MSRQVLAEGADARTTVDLLRDVRSVNDVRIDVWRPKDAARRLLRLDGQRKLWSLRAAPPPPPEPGGYHVTRGARGATRHG